MLPDVEVVSGSLLGDVARESYELEASRHSRSHDRDAQQLVADSVHWRELYHGLWSAVNYFPPFWQSRRQLLRCRVRASEVGSCRQIALKSVCRSARGWRVAAAGAGMALLDPAGWCGRSQTGGKTQQRSSCEDFFSPPGTTMAFFAQIRHPPHFLCTWALAGTRRNFDPPAGPDIDAARMPQDGYERERTGRGGVDLGHPPHFLHPPFLSGVPAATYSPRPRRDLFRRPVRGVNAGSCSAFVVPGGVASGDLRSTRQKANGRLDGCLAP